MPIIKTKKDWWDTVDAYWDEITFLFHMYVGLDKVISDNGDTVQSELTSLRDTKCVFISELISVLYNHLLDTDLPTDDYLEEAVGILYDLYETMDLLYSRERVYKDKGRGNQNEGLKKNEGLEARRERFKKIMVSSWAGEL